MLMTYCVSTMWIWQWSSCYFPACPLSWDLLMSRAEYEHSRSFTITESLLKAPTSGCLNMVSRSEIGTLVSKYHNRRAALRIYANQTDRSPLWSLNWCTIFVSTYRALVGNFNNNNAASSIVVSTVIGPADQMQPSHSSSLTCLMKKLGKCASNHHK